MEDCSEGDRIWRAECTDYRVVEKKIYARTRRLISCRIVSYSRSKRVLRVLSEELSREGGRCGWEATSF